MTSLPAQSEARNMARKDLEGHSFDYIIIGGGTAGCLIAARLSLALPTSRILLVEAGGEVDEEDLVPGYIKPRFGSSDGNWLFETLPQRELNNRKIVYPRGRGLGGCSGNNFMAWVRGPSADYDDWAEAVGDDWWKWENVVTYMKQLEDFRPACPDGMKCYADPTPGFHQTGGEFAVGYGSQWQPIIEFCMRAGQEAGHEINLDNNDGNPLGISIAQFNVDNGVRNTSATAFLPKSNESNLRNLVVVTNTIASKLLFNGKRVVGVQLLPTSKKEADIPLTVNASQEVILTAGCFQTPQLLLLSGVGPAGHLADHEIPLIHDNPAVGRNLQDHSAFACEFIIDQTIKGHNQLLNNPTELDAAVKEYNLTKSGPLAVFGASASIIFPKLPRLLDSEEFKSLPIDTQKFMNAKTRPGTEIWMHSGPLFYTGECPPDASVLVLEGLCQNNLSRGSLHLISSDPREPPGIDPSYLSHPYDMRIAIETLREIIKLSQTPTFSSIIKSTLLAPDIPVHSAPVRSTLGSDEMVLETFIRDTLTQGFHAMSTCVMAKPQDSNKVVQNDFIVEGLKGLRIADMSTCPILTSNHTQINAYLIGERCSQLIIKDANQARKQRLAKL